MKKLLTIAGCAWMITVLPSCGGNDQPGRAYAPDMVYSRAYETYGSTEDIAKAGAYYNERPVPGTVARGDAFPYPLKHDSIGYAQSATYRNPLSPDSINMKEAERLYLINCAICHGSKLDGNGPLFNGGDGPYTAAPKNFMDAAMKEMTEGTMFHSVTYGKGQMGSYASQLNTKQRWMVIAYIKSKQGGAAGAAAPAAKDSAAATTTPAPAPAAGAMAPVAAK